MSNLENEPVTTEVLLRNIHTVWHKLQMMLDVMSKHQLTQYTDEQGWSIKDHIIHMSVWERGITALLNKQDRTAAMGIQPSDWDNGVDAINKIIWTKHKDLSLDEVLGLRDEIHQHLIDTIEGLHNDDLSQPYTYYDPEAHFDKPVINWIVGNTFAHYAEHIEWIEAMMNN